MLVTSTDMEKLNKINKEYPETLEWMKSKADWEHMSLSAVLHEYENYVNELMRKEDALRHMG